MKKRIRKYVFSDMHEIQGYLSPVDALTIAAVLSAQQDNGLTGGIAEIGVFYGRSFFLMQLVANGSDSCFAADLFDIRAHRNIDDQYDQFIKNGRKLGFAVNEEQIYVGDSKFLSADYIRERVGSCRLFHIDGGHHWQHVAVDSQIAMNSMADHGVIVFDDFFNPEWPDVSLAAVDFLTSQRHLKPFAITNRKLYVSKADHVDAYQNWVCSSEFTTKIPRREVNLFDAPVPFLKESLDRKIGFFLLTRYLRGLGANWLY